jgi:hypothetical protein
MKLLQKPWKNIQKKIISDLPTLIFLRYETGTTGIFLRPVFRATDLYYDILHSQWVTVCCVYLYSGHSSCGTFRSLFMQYSIIDNTICSMYSSSTSLQYSCCYTFSNYFFISQQNLKIRLYTHTVYTNNTMKQISSRQVIIIKQVTKCCWKKKLL